MTCVCGHARVDHRDVAMSVPLVGADHYRPFGLPQITKSHPSATYGQQACWCGCTIFEDL